MTHWTAEFIGLPYEDLGRSIEGVDCWGLVRLAFAKRGIDVPTYSGAYASTEERAEISALINREKPNWNPVEEACEFDLLIFRRGLLESHCGIVVKPGWMLHVTEELPSCIENYHEGFWEHRLKAILRHSQLMTEGVS